MTDKLKMHLQDSVDAELIPWELSKRLSDGDNPIRVWREYRGMTQAALAEAADVSRLDSHNGHGRVAIAVVGLVVTWAGIAGFRRAETTIDPRNLTSKRQPDCVQPP